MGHPADLSFRLRLHSGLRQSGGAYGAAFCGTAEAVPFRLGLIQDLCGTPSEARCGHPETGV